MQYQVLDVCKYIIKYIDNKEYCISNLKLQKLLYFIQAYFLVDKGCPCFIENIEAWGFGPVVPEAYYKYKRHGANAIYNEMSYDFIASDDKKRINEIVDQCEDWSSADLTDITQNQTPWKQAYVHGMRRIISNESVRNFFDKTERH